MATKPKIDFTPVPVRHRHDGWTPERQSQFLEALAQCGCVDEACRRVGMGRSSAYELRARMDAESFRAGWSVALDHGVGRLEDAAFSRAINGVTRPVFYKGEQIGERTYYDERLAMFLLRYRDPARYGRWRDQTRPVITPDGVAQYLGTSSTAPSRTPGTTSRAFPERTECRRTRCRPSSAKPSCRPSGKGRNAPDVVSALSASNPTSRAEGSDCAAIASFCRRAVTGVNPVTSVLSASRQAGRLSPTLRAAPATLRVGVAALGGSSNVPLLFS